MTPVELPPSINAVFELTADPDRAAAGVDIRARNDPRARAGRATAGRACNIGPEHCNPIGGAFCARTCSACMLADYTEYTTYPATSRPMTPLIHCSPLLPTVAHCCPLPHHPTTPSLHHATDLGLHGGAACMLAEYTVMLDAQNPRALKSIRFSPHPYSYPPPPTYPPSPSSSHLRPQHALSGKLKGGTKGGSEGHAQT